MFPDYSCYQGTKVQLTAYVKLLVEDLFSSTQIETIMIL